MYVLVTGGGGFLGSNLVKRLVARGDRVRILARGEYPEIAALGVECLRGDLGDPAATLRAVEGVDSVFHVASRVGYWGPRAEYFRTNVEGTKNLLEACRRSKVSRLVYTSTPSVVVGEGGIEGGDETLPYPSKHLYDYAASKAEAEQLVLAASAGGLPTCAIRPHFIFGPGDPQIVPRLVERARQGRLVRVGDGSNLVDVTYIDSCVDAHVRAHDALHPGSPVAGQAYFIGQEAPVRLWDFIEDVLKGCGAPLPKRQVSLGTAKVLGAIIEGTYRTLGIWSKEPPLTRAAAVMLGTSHAFRHTKAERDFGYRPSVTTPEALARTIAWWRGASP